MENQHGKSKELSEATLLETRVSVFNGSKKPSRRKRISDFMSQPRSSKRDSEV
jgi:hypothetical protein